MGTVIEDGTGGAYKAKVDSNNRIRGYSITEETKDHHGELGYKFNINTGDITLTNGTKTSVFYLKNNEEKDLIVTALIYNLGNTTGGSGDVKIDVLRNPTAGDIVTNTNNTAVSGAVAGNQNFGSQRTLTIDAYKGASGETAFSDGSLTISTRSASNTGRIVVSLGSLVLEKGSTLGLDYTPPSGNSSQICQFAVACYLQQLEA